MAPISNSHSTPRAFVGTLKLRVLVYTESILPTSETFISDHVRMLQGLHDVSLVGLHRAPGQDLGDLDVRVFLKEPPNPITRLRIRGGVDSDFLRFLQDQQPDIIHCHFSHNGTFLLPYARLLGASLLVSLHGSDILGKRRLVSVSDHLYRARLGQLSDYASAFFTCSEYLRRKAVSHGFPLDKTFCHYNAVNICADLEQARHCRQKLQSMAFVGRLIEIKGIRNLLLMHDIVRASVPEAQLEIVGDGPLRPLVEEAARRTGGIIYHGSLPKKDAIEVVARARLLALPSVEMPNGQAEAFGLVLAEAQAHGVPVITSGLGGTIEALQPGITGFVVDPHDISGMANTAIRLLLDDTLQNSMSRAAESWANQMFSVRDARFRLCRIYDDATS